MLALYYGVVYLSMYRRSPRGGAKETDATMNTHHTVADDSDREVVSFRLPKSEILRIEALAKRRAEKMPGQRVTRTDALRSLYLFALANMEEVGS